MAKMFKERKKFLARVAKFGEKASYIGWPQETVMLKDVKDAESGEIVTDHLWMIVGKQFESAHLTIGDNISFYARVTAYTKGYKGRNYEKQIDHPISEDY